MKTISRRRRQTDNLLAVVQDASISQNDDEIMDIIIALEDEEISTDEMVQLLRDLRNITKGNG